MIPSKAILILPSFFLILSGSKGQDTLSSAVLSKIDFDVSAVDDRGLVNSEVALDYEFCIPMNDATRAEILTIEPTVSIPKLAKGRIGCSDQEWLCIVSTNGPKWKERLYAIASLPYVKHIVQTFYE